MKQSKKHSLIESILQSVTGLAISVIGQVVIYYLLDIKVSFNQNIIITTFFFILSFCRSYIIRRIFNNLK